MRVESKMFHTEDGEEYEVTEIDGEGHTTFIKRDQNPGHAIHLGKAHDLHICNHTFVMLTGNPFKDCRTLWRWYFPKGWRSVLASLLSSLLSHRRRQKWPDTVGIHVELE